MNTVGQWVEKCAQSLSAGEVCFGHGTDNALDEAAWLVLQVLGLPVDGSYEEWDRRVEAAEGLAIQRLLERRITERKPLAYLFGEAWFCGLRFHVNESVLVPRSPMAELIERQFQPWVQPERLERVLDLCTGSGCIAIATASRLPHVAVDAADLSAEALELAAENVHAHQLEGRVRLIRSDLFSALGERRYDLIVSNPPYVSDDEIGRLPPEYRWEPDLGFRAEQDGLELVLRILRDAPEHLAENGMLICEVGEAADRLAARLPECPFTWLEFEHGGGGVFTIDREALVQSGITSTGADKPLKERPG